MKLIFQRESQRLFAHLGKLQFLIFFMNFSPATSQLEEMVKLIDAGMSVARLNLSHGSIKSNLKIMRQFKQAKRLRPHRTVSLMIEPRGREIRLS